MSCEQYTGTHLSIMAIRVQRLCHLLDYHKLVLLDYGMHENAKL